MLLRISDLHAGTDDVEILKGFNLELEQGKVYAIMGPNGSGKSTLAKVLAGDPAYHVSKGSVEFEGEDLLEQSPDERSRNGVFLAFQYPQEITGVSNLNFLRTALNARRDEDIPVGKFRKLLMEKMKLLQMDDSFATRFVNLGFSGGEKKRNEILQMALLEPKLAILDETDSGLDIDALRVVSKGVNSIMASTEPKPTILLITHYNRILDYITPDVVHVLWDGKIIRSGGKELAAELEEKGYDSTIEENTKAGNE